MKGDVQSGLEKFLLFVSNISILIHLFVVCQLQIPDAFRVRNEPVPDTQYTYRGCSIKMPDLPKNKQKCHWMNLNSIICEFFSLNPMRKKL